MDPLQIEGNGGLPADLIAKFETWTDSEDEFPVDFDEIWRHIGYSRKDAAKRTLEHQLVENADYISTKLRINGQRGRPTEKIRLSQSGFEQFCMQAPTEQGRRVRAIYIDIKNRHLALRAAIVRGDVELRANVSADDCEGYVDARNLERARSLETYQEQMGALKQNPSINNFAARIHTNTCVSRAALGMLPSALKRELGVSNTESACNYMDTAQLASVVHSRCAARNIAIQCEDYKSYSQQITEMTNIMYDFNQRYGIHGNRGLPRLAKPMRANAPAIGEAEPGETARLIQ